MQLLHTMLASGDWNWFYGLLGGTMAIVFFLSRRSLHLSYKLGFSLFLGILVGSQIIQVFVENSLFYGSNRLYTSLGNIILEIAHFSMGIICGVIARGPSSRNHP